MITHTYYVTIKIISAQASSVHIIQTAEIISVVIRLRRLVTTIKNLFFSTYRTTNLFDRGSFYGATILCVLGCFSALCIL